MIRSNVLSQVKDTSQDYDDLVGYTAEENLPKTLSNFLDEEQEYQPEVKPKKVDPEFPEEWQTVIVNFKTNQDYVDFMSLIDEFPGPKTKKVVFKKDKDDGLMEFFS